VVVFGWEEHKNIAKWVVLPATELEDIGYNPKQPASIAISEVGEKICGLSL